MEHNYKDKIKRQTEIITVDETLEYVISSNDAETIYNAGKLEFLQSDSCILTLAQAIIKTKNKEYIKRFLKDIPGAAICFLKLGITKIENKCIIDMEDAETIKYFNQDISLEKEISLLSRKNQLLLLNRWVILVHPNAIKYAEFILSDKSRKTTEVPTQKKIGVFAVAKMNK